MYDLFVYWILTKYNSWGVQGIRTIEVKIRGFESNNPSVTVDNESDTCLGRITVWKSGFMDMEILETQSGNTTLFKHIELSQNPDFESILHEYTVRMNEVNY